MASIRKEILIDARPEEVWSAVRDVGAVHRRLAPGFVIDVRPEGDFRIVTFANGAVVRELIVDIDDAARRFVYAAVGGRATHHNASMQVFNEGGEHREFVEAYVEFTHYVERLHMDARSAGAHHEGMKEDLPAEHHH